MGAPEIVTERLKLTPFLAGDAAALFEYRSDSEVGRYQSWAPDSLADALHFIEGLQSLAFDTPDSWFQLAIRLRESGRLVGDLGAHFPADEPHQVEIGVTIAGGHQGRGFGTEAVRGLLGHLFGALRKHRVFASVDPRNRPSIALLERVGMRREAHFRKSLFFKGEWVDDLVFGILESEWKDDRGETLAMEARVRQAWARTRIRVWPERCILAGLPVDRLGEAATIAGTTGGGFAGLVLEREEVSLTLEEGRWEESGLSGICHGSSGPYRAITLDAELELDLCGYLAPAAARLAEARVPIVPQCGHRTDHLLVREEDLATALRVLEGLAGGGSSEG